MSSYIIAGSADSIDTAYCEQIARRIKSKYKNIDFRFVIKHPSEWEEYLQQICRIYGFLKKSNPIIYTFDGKIIGNKQSFMSVTAKYFGLDEDSLNVQNLTNEVNMKIATQQINRKHVQRNNIQTFSQKIQSKHQALLKKGILKHQLKDKKIYLTNGIQYIYREVKGLVPNIAFTKNKQIKAEIQEIQASNIDLMAISLNDQIKVEEQPGVTATVTAAGKEAFVTANEKNNSQHDRMSQASRTNKMHESVVSYDKDSKQMKQSSKSKLRIDEQNDDVPDYIDIPMEQTEVTELADHFFVGFCKNSHISGQMIFYHNQDSNGNFLRVHNDNRPVKGHRVLIKQIHFDGQNPILQQNSSQLIQNQEGDLNEGNEDESKNLEEGQASKELSKDKIQLIKEENSSILRSKPLLEIQKIKTQPNIPSVVTSNKNIPPDDAFSQINSDLNLVSNLNYHTLFILKPLSIFEVTNLIHFIRETNCIATLQFLAENPNPKVNLYDRKILLDKQLQSNSDFSLPIQKFIEKQLQDNQFTKTTVPNQQCEDYEEIQGQNKYDLLQINDIGFEHYLYEINQQTNPEGITKALKHSIDAMLALQQLLKKDIGYNLIFTKKFMLLVPLSDPYEVYDSKKLFLDGLAFLGFVQTADLLRPYQLKNSKLQKTGQYIREMLKISSNIKYQ